jgi:hypothetical protein
MITTRPTVYIKDVAEDIDITTANMEEDSAAPRVTIEITTNINRKKEILARDTVKIIKNIKEDLVRKNIISTSNLDTNQTNIPWRSVNKHILNSVNIPSTR